ncbi:integrase [Rhodobacterales bacterium 52_120_T64]|nr:integrase [Rhodobacterales bacterium 52_120_T64]
MATIRINRGKWQAIVRRTGFPQQSKSFDSKTIARKWARQKEAELDTGVIHTDTRILDNTTVSDILLRYRETVTINKKGHASEGKRIDSFLKQPWANYKLSRVTSGVFSHYRDQRLKQVRPATVRRDLGLLRAIFEVAKQEWDMPFQENPLINVRKPKEPNARTRRLESGELDLLLSVAESRKGGWLKAGIQIAIETGMRRGELLSALWSDVSFTNSTLLIRETKNGHPRCIPLTAEAVAILRSQKPTEWSVTDRVFPVTANAFQISWQRCKKIIAKDYPDISDLRFHDLRHEAISRFFEIGLSIPEVALISGHRDPRMLFRYTHLRAEVVLSRFSAAPVTHLSGYTFECQGTFPA